MSVHLGYRPSLFIPALIAASLLRIITSPDPPSSEADGQRARNLVDVEGACPQVPHPHYFRTLFQCDFKSIMLAERGVERALTVSSIVPQLAP